MIIQGLVLIIPEVLLIEYNINKRLGFQKENHFMATVKLQVQADMIFFQSKKLFTIEMINLINRQ